MLKFKTKIVLITYITNILRISTKNPLLNILKVAKIVGLMLIVLTWR